MKRIIAAFAVLLISTLIAFAQETTLVEDWNAARMLRGRHMLSLQWVSWDYFGVATVTDRNGLYSIQVSNSAMICR